MINFLHYRLQFKHLYHLLFSIFFFLFLFLFFLSPVFAQSEGFEISPSLAEFSLQPQITRHRQLQITSHFNVPTTFNLSVSQIQSGNNSHLNASSWITLQRQTLTINPNSSDETVALINVPANASPGTYSASIIVTPNLTESSHITNNNSDQSSLNINQQLVATFIINIEGHGENNGQITAFRAIEPQHKAKKSIWTQLPITFDLQYQNTGTAITSSFGQISFYNFFNQKISELNINDFITKPNEKHRQQIIFQPQNNLAPGLYQARLDLNNNFGHNLIARNFFWYLPPLQTTILIIIIIVIILLITGGIIWFFYRHLYQNWREEQHREQRFKRRHRL